jgi:hypothetical protein
VDIEALNKRVTALEKRVPPEKPALPDVVTPMRNPAQLPTSARKKRVAKPKPEDDDNGGWGTQIKNPREPFYPQKPGDI